MKNRRGGVGRSGTALGVIKHVANQWTCEIHCQSRSGQALRGIVTDRGSDHFAERNLAATKREKNF